MRYLREIPHAPGNYVWRTVGFKRVPFCDYHDLLAQTDEKIRVCDAAQPDVSAEDRQHVRASVLAQVAVVPRDRHRRAAVPPPTSEP